MTAINEYEQFLSLACDLARRGGELAKSLVGKTAASRKADKSVVTEADKKVQDLIVGELAVKYPDHGLIAEEETPLTAGRPGGDAEYVWSIDPIDGTRNYASGIHVYCCSIALLRNGQPVVGAIYEPNFNWLFSAAAGRPATLNGEVISVRRERFSKETVLAFAISTYAHRPACLHKLMDDCVVRNAGTVALHLGMVASGKMDATINCSGKLWDIAAGALIARQAGADIRLLNEQFQFEDRPLWPMNLADYHNEAIPIAVGNSDLMADLNKFLKGTGE
jgi:myo-inositol-1(or 4)-monophosphatase